MDVWSSVYAVDPDEAERFAAFARIGIRYDGSAAGTGFKRDALRCVVDPTTCTVRLLDDDHQ